MVSDKIWYNVLWRNMANYLKLSLLSLLIWSIVGYSVFPKYLDNRHSSMNGRGHRRTRRKEVHSRDIPMSLQARIIMRIRTKEDSLYLQTLYIQINVLV